MSGQGLFRISQYVSHGKNRSLAVYSIQRRVMALCSFTGSGDEQPRGVEILLGHIGKQFGA